jgi:hypothetical protein
LPAEWFASGDSSLCLKEEIRPADQTFLTYPEWFLVNSPAEQADYFKAHTATTFPYMGHVAQFWDSYKMVYRPIKDKYPFNTGYHFMIWVIGSSATAEYALKAAYETTIGRLTDTDSGQTMTDEDRFNAVYTQQYVGFIKVYPWYEFDFKKRLGELWSSTSLFDGGHMLRKWERKYWLTTELLAKWGYSWLIKLGTKAAYEDAVPATAVVVDKVPSNTHIKVEKVFSDSSALLILPRYQAFKTAVSELTAENISFKEIAGNKSAVLITALVPSGLALNEKDAKPLFSQDILTKPGLQRLAIVCPVSQLSKTIRWIDAKHLNLEHIYDY